MSKPGMHKFGDWDLVRNMTMKMGATIDQSLKQSLMQITSRAEMMAVRFLADQSLSWQPLSKRYLDQKERKNQSNKILIATSTYFQSVTSKVSGNVGFAGVLKKERDKDGNVIADIAAVHEYGSIGRNIPPRRLWIVVFKHMRQFLVKNKMVQRNVITDINRSIGR